MRDSCVVWSDGTEVGVFVLAALSSVCKIVGLEVDRILCLGIMGTGPLFLGFAFCNTLTRL